MSWAEVKTALNSGNPADADYQPLNEQMDDLSSDVLTAISTQTTTIKSGLKPKLFRTTISAGSSLTIGTGGKIISVMSNLESSYAYVTITMDGITMTTSSSYGMAVSGYEYGESILNYPGTTSSSTTYFSAAKLTSTYSTGFTMGSNIMFNTATISVSGVGAGLIVTYLKYV